MSKKSDFKFVKKANMYVRTWFEGKTQRQEWITKQEYEALP